MEKILSVSVQQTVGCIEATVKSICTALSIACLSKTKTVVSDDIVDFSVTVQSGGILTGKITRENSLIKIVCNADVEAPFGTMLETAFMQKIINSLSA